MWVLLTQGAVSIVKFNHAPEGDPRTMQVRTRREEWLAGFAKYMDRKPEFIHSTNKDYSWRFFATPEEVSAAVGRAVLDIGYSNFKNATSSTEFGLADSKLRHGLHAAYSTTWSTLLKAGDGTSLYDVKSTYGGAGSNFDAGTIDACARLGHWWKTPVPEAKCADCGTPRSAYPRSKASDVVRPSKAQVAAWWKSHPAVKRPASVKGGKGGTPSAVKAKPEGAFSAQCPGSGLAGISGTEQAEAGGVTSECWVCHGRFVSDGDFMPVHDRAHVVPVPETGDLSTLQAARDAAETHYQEIQSLYDHGSAAEDDLDDALTAYSDADDAYNEALLAEDFKANA